MPTYHVRAYLGTGSKHQFTLPVGVVDLTWEQGGQLIRPTHRLIEKALAIPGAKKRKNVRIVNEKENKKTYITDTCACADKIAQGNLSWYVQFKDNPVFSELRKYNHVSSPS